MKNLIWLADSRLRVKSFPAGVRDDIGYALYAAQLGERSIKAKPLHGLRSQVMEIVTYVIHAFQKKSKAGIATPNAEIDLIRRRLKQLKGEVNNAKKRGS